MRARCKILLNNSLSAALSAIEIYNKPNFEYREASFCYLIINAWELLLKAKILHDNGNRLKSIYKYHGRFIRRNRSNNPITVSIYETFAKIGGLDERIIENLNGLIVIRDATTHFYATSKSLPYLVFSLGTACLKNYEKCCREWFSYSLTKYNFYILPLGFNFNFRNLSMVDLKREPVEIVNIINLISQKQSFFGNSQPSDFQFICEIKIQVISAKKIDRAVVIGKITSDVTEANFIERETDKLDKYPYTFTQILAEAKKKNQNIKQNKLTGFIKERKIKGNIEYHEYAYSSKKNEIEKKYPSDIYNYDFLQLIINDSYFK